MNEITEIMKLANDLQANEKEAVLSLIATISLNRSCEGKNRSAHDLLMVSLVLVQSHEMVIAQ